MREDDKLLPSSGRSGDSYVPAVPQQGGVPEAYGSTPYYGGGDEESSIDLRRYLMALLRYKWLLIAAVVLGAAGAVMAWRSTQVQYTADGTLWIEVERGGQMGDVSPIRQSGLLQQDAWIQLLRSYTVLDSVVVSQGLYITRPEAYAEAFQSFQLDSVFRAGEYELTVGADGESYSLAVQEGAPLEEGTLGRPIGRELGFQWSPRASYFAAGAVVPFSVRAPRDAAQALSSQLSSQMDQTGNFLRLRLSGTDPVRITSILNSVMDRHVRVAAELKRSRLEVFSSILEDQLRYAQEELADAERQLEEFRIQTITLPDDRAMPIASGLQMTQGPVFSDFFRLRMDFDEMRRDRERLEEALRSIEDAGHVQIEALEMIPSAASASELRIMLGELNAVRTDLRTLEADYTDDYPLVRDALDRQQRLETVSIPGVIRGVLDQLRNQERQLQGRIDLQSQELQSIPPRRIEEGRRERRVQSTEKLYNEIRSRVETARLAAASSIPDVRILDRALVPNRPTEDARVRWAAMVFLAFVGAAAAGAILLDRMDARFRYASDVSRDIGLDILGSIPRIQNAKGKRGVLNAAQALEAFRELRIHMGFAYGSAGPITLTISSPSAGEGKSLISSNLAVAFAEVGRRTLLIDGDTRRGDAHRLLGLEQGPGLIDYLKERSGQEIIQSTPHDNLDFIACGSRGASTPELLASPKMAHFMGTLKRSYDVIVVDSPPLAAGGDALILATLTGNLGVVIRTGTTERQLAQAKLDQLSRLPIRVLGAILNDVDPSDGFHYYYSAYLPGYEPVPEEGDEDVQLISG